MTEKYQPHLHDNALLGQDDPENAFPGGEGEGERVAKTLARSGVASRREVERLIEGGRVALNGAVLTSPAVKVRPGDILTVDGKIVDEPEPTRLFRYHKPTGLLTSHNDPGGRPTVFQALPRELPRVISVGRLDLNSEGLLLLTNDGELSRALEMPQNAWQRRYRARAFGVTTQEKLDRLKNGITVDGVRYGAIEARLDKAQDKAGGKNLWITVTLSEGKNREVRKVLEAIGLKVNRLIRLSYGPFALGTLLPGQVEEVGPRVIRELLEGIVPEENMPKGDKPKFAGVAEPLKAPGQAGGGDVQRRGVPRAGKLTQAAVILPEEKAEPEKFVRKPGWAKPKKKPVIAAKPPRAPASGKGPSKPTRAKKSIESKIIGPKALTPREAANQRIREKQHAAKAGEKTAKTSARTPAKTDGKPGGARPSARPSGPRPATPRGKR
ncbi:MAG: pseudouridine synthase [Caulobacter sp.]|nr:pseudouridine synthase [Caulobacter sp.]